MRTFALRYFWHSPQLTIGSIFWCGGRCWPFGVSANRFPESPSKPTIRRYLDQYGMHQLGNDAERDQKKLRRSIVA